MPQVTLHYDLRAPDFGPPIQGLYEAALAQCEWADTHGFARVVLSCHHGSDDNYCPSQLITATAIAARTKNLRIVPVVALPLYHPLHVAEDVAVLDIISGGRAELLVVAGYHSPEFAMFGQTMDQRARLMEDGVHALVQAWSGEPFEFRGEHVLVRPRPLQRPHPPIIMGGDSPAAARRAARLGVAFFPVSGSPVYDDYLAACRQLGREAPPRGRLPTWMFLHITNHPDETVEKIAPYLLHVTNSYAKWLADAGATAVYEPITDVEALRASGNFRIVTPQQCIELVSDLDEIMLDPLFGGLPPDIAWQSLELFVEQVLPALKA